nr:MDIS1-interacting receptor like kinase 1 [Ipomoea batatas]
MAKFNSSESVKIDSRLVRMCIEAATESRDAIEAWRRQRRTLERLPSQLADVLFHRLLRRRLLFPSLLEYVSHSIHFSMFSFFNCAFQNSIHKVNLYAISM